MGCGASTSRPQHPSPRPLVPQLGTASSVTPRAQIEQWPQPETGPKADLRPGDAVTYEGRAYTIQYITSKGKLDLRADCGDVEYGIDLAAVARCTSAQVGSVVLLDGVRCKVQYVTSKGLLDLKAVEGGDVHYGVDPAAVRMLEVDATPAAAFGRCWSIAVFPEIQAAVASKEYALSPARIELLGGPLVKVMGSGARLFKCHLDGGSEVLAAKLLPATAHGHKVTEMTAEIALCRHLVHQPHAHIVRFELLAERVEIASERYLAIVMEMVPVTLLDLIQTRAAAMPRRPFGSVRLAAIAANLAAALDHLHSVCHPPMLHRDVKPLNICFPANAFEADLESDALDTSAGVPTTALDSGLRLIDVGEAALSAVPIVDYVGTPVITPPEMFLGEPHHSAADVWGFGIVLLWCLLLEPSNVGPMGSMSMPEWEACVTASPHASLAVFEEPTGGGRPWPAALEPFAALARRCLARSPAERPTAREAEASCIEIALSVHELES